MAISNGVSVQDNKPYIEYDSLIGYRYLPNLNLQLPRPGGGSYAFITNSQSIRSAREYSIKKPPGVYRIIVCGDSMPAGQYVSNEQRFTEQLERLLPNVEVINLSLEGSGTDQQLLLYENIGLQYEHDLVLLLPFLSNIERNMLDARVGFDAKTGATVLRGKPRFELVDGQLQLRNVPVPRDNNKLALAEPTSGKTDAQQTWVNKLKTNISSLPGANMLKKLGYAAIPWEPFPVYRDANSPEWLLMAAIIKRFKNSAGSRPLLIIPTFYDNYVRYRMARNYWQRFNSLSTVEGIQIIDLLPYFQQLGSEGVRCFQAPYDMHFSAYGHLIVADAIMAELRNRKLLPA